MNFFSNKISCTTWRPVLTFLAGFVLVSCGGGGSDNTNGSGSGNNPTSYYGSDEVQVDNGGVALGISVPYPTGTVFTVLAETTTIGMTMTIVPGASHSSICGTSVGGGCHNFLSGSQIVWNNLPISGHDLAGTLTFVLDNGTYTGTIAVPGIDISGTPYQIRSTQSIVKLTKV